MRLEISDKDIDVLDLIRDLTSQNINDDLEVSEFFWKALLEKFSENVSSRDYVEPLSDSYLDSRLKDWDFSNSVFNETSAKYYLAGRFSEIIQRQFAYGLIEDKGGRIYAVDSDIVVVLGCFKGIKKIVGEFPDVFDLFKRGLLLGLVGFHAKNVYSSKGKDKESLERLNKAILIYAECFEETIIFEEIPYVLNESSLGDLFKRFDNSKTALTWVECHSLALNVWFNIKKSHPEFKKGGPIGGFEDEELVEFEDEEPILEVSPPKSKSSLKTNLSRVVAAVLAAAAVCALSFHVKRNINVVPPLDNEPTVGVSVPVSTEPNSGIDDITDNENDDIKDDDIKDDDEEQIVSAVPGLWDTVIMNSDEIYSDMYSAANKENPLKAYFGAEKEYTIIGVVLSKGEGLKMVNISTPDGQGLIDALLADGFKCVAYSITVMGNELDRNNLLYNSNMVTGFVPSDGVSLIVGNNLSIVR